MKNKDMRRFLTFIKFVLMIDKDKGIDIYHTSKNKLGPLNG
jgi:hypothetical protein